MKRVYFFQTEIRQGEKIIPVSSLLVDESFEYFKNDFSDLDVEIFDKTKAADVKFVGQVEDIKDAFASGRKYEPFDMRVIEVNALEVNQEQSQSAFSHTKKQFYRQLPTNMVPRLSNTRKQTSF